MLRARGNRRALGAIATSAVLAGLLGLVGAPADAHDADVAGGVGHADAAFDGADADHDQVPATPPDSVPTLPYVADPPPPRPLETLTIRGAYVIVAAGSEDHATAPALVKADGRVFMLAGDAVASGGLVGVEAGSRVEVDAVRYPAGSLTGLGIGDEGDLKVESVRVLRAAAASTSRTGTRGAFIAVIQWPGMTRPALASSGSDYSRDALESIGAWSKSASSDVFEWQPTVVEMTLPAQPNCDDGAWRNAVIAKASTLGYDIVRDYRALAILLPQGVTDADLADDGALQCVPTAYAYMGEGWGNDVWWLGLSVYSAGYSFKSVLVHELGHSLGLPHAESAPCAEAGTAVSLTYTGTCAHKEYGDVYDPMGQSFSSTRFNPIFSDHLGWLLAANRVDLTPFSSGAASGSVTTTLTAFGDTGPGIRAVTTELAEPESGSLALQIPGTLYIDYRRAAGFESDWTYAEPGDKVYLRWKPSAAAATLLKLQQPDSYLIDTTPLTASAYDAGLTPGATWTDPTGRLTVRFDSRSATMATANVTVSWTALGGLPLPRNAAVQSPSARTIAVTWAAPANTSAISGYRVDLTSGLGSGAMDTQSCDVALGATLSCSFTGLRHNTAYTASIVSVDAAGTKSLARTATVTTPVVPLQFQRVRVVAAGASSVTLRPDYADEFTPNNVAGRSYAYCHAADWSWTGAYSNTATPAATPPYDIVLTGLAAGVGKRSRCWVAARANDGTWAATWDYTTGEFTFNGTVAPAAPAIGVITAAKTSLTVPFSVPSNDGGADIIGYDAQCTGGGATVTVNDDSSSPIEVTGLVEDTEYSCRVRASNGIATSAWSAPVVRRTGDVIVPQAQSVEVAAAVPAWAATGDSPVSLAATADSGKAVTFGSSSAACAVSGSTMRPVSVGPCLITASVAADEAWLAASTSFTIQVVPAPPAGSVGVVIAGGAAWTNQTKPAVKVVWPRGANRMRVAFTAGALAGATWISVASSPSVNLPPSSPGSQPNPRELFIEFSGPGLPSNVTKSDTVGLDTDLPTVGSATSKALTKLAGGKKTWQVTVKVTDGASGFATIEVAKSTSLAATVYSVPASITSLSTALALNYTAAPGSYRIRVVDRAGNVSAWKAIALS